jgi:hypothetical protein
MTEPIFYLRHFTMKKQPINITKIARENAVCRSTVQRWQKLGAPITDPQKLTAWRQSRPKLPPLSSESSDSIRAARLRKLTAEAATVEMRLRREKGELMLKSEAIANVRVIAAAVRSGLRQLIGEVPNWAGLPPHELQARAKAFVTALEGQFHDSTSALYRQPS